ncbi:hypothetical protein DFH07DRAFT_1037321 [Mycena maculata]|uniref:Uncharacterized protein n=1 Tax=Mycena maculata TaxID=230809 RepID=A0AAD7INI2_9AGAR|nr:hypothetical protein DFH07DRAFT_1037321 [Mycena maculata]
MVAHPSLPLTNLVGIIVGTLFYGMYCIIFVISIYLLFESARGSGKYRPLFMSAVFVSGCALFIAITANWVATLVRIFEAFIYFPPGARVYLNDASQLNETLSTTFLSLSVAIGDAMIIYRLWVVWSYNRLVIVIPILSLLGFIVSCIITVQATAQLTTNAELEIALDVGLTPVTVFTLLTNFYCTALITWEIWRITSNCMPHFLAIIVESAAIYTSWAIYYTTCHQLNSSLQFIALDAFPPVAGIANGLIHVRVGLGRTVEQLYDSEAKTGSSVATAPMIFASQPSGAGSGETGAVATVQRWQLSDAFEAVWTVDKILPAVNIDLVANVIGTLFYGMYFIIFVISMYLLFESARGTGKYLPLFRSAVFISGGALFIAITTNWVATLLRIFTGFIYLQQVPDASSYWENDSGAAETVSTVFLSLSVAIGDAMIIYRLWVVWSYNKLVIIIPILSLLGFIASCIITIQATVHITNGLAGIVADVGLTPVTVFTLVTNVYCTAFITWKIWRITSDCMPNFLAIVVESAAIYTSWAIYYTICHQLNSTLQFIALDAFPPVAGIANALIHVRVGLGRTVGQLYGSKAKTGSSVLTAPVRFVAPHSSGTSGGETGTMGQISRV